MPTLDRGKEELFEKDQRGLLGEVLRDYMKGRRWFRGKARSRPSVEIEDVIPMRFGQSGAYIVLVRCQYAEGEPDTYVVPLTAAPAEDAGGIIDEYPPALVADLETENTDGRWLLYDALVNRAFCQSLLLAIGQERRFRGERGEISASPTRIFSSARSHGEAALEPVPMKVEQSNTSVVYGERLVLKLFRRPDEGLNPELEIGRFLTEETVFTHISRVAGSMEYRRRRGKPMSLAILQEYIANKGDAWKYTLDSLEDYLGHVPAGPAARSPSVPRGHLVSLPEPPPLAKEIIGPYLDSARLLGRRTAGLHQALASGLEDPDFAPEYFTSEYQTSLYRSMHAFTTGTLHMLRERLPYVPGELQGDARKVLGLEKDILGRYQPIRGQKITAARIRCHGDYHLGQVLFTGRDFVIIDFEGEPARSLDERRMKRSPLLDVAGMIRSFHYAAHSALAGKAPLAADDLTLLHRWAQYWYVWVAAAFLSSYLKEVGPAGLLPGDPEHLRILLDAYILDKAVYEIGYELNNRPDWLKVPLQGILQLMEAGSRMGANAGE